PTLIIPPNYNFSKKINKTLISTSLHDKEKTFFEEFVSGKLGLKSDVLLYSKVFHPIDAFATSTATALGGAWVSIETFSQEAVVERIKKGENWKKLAEAQGVHVDLKVDDNTKDFVESLMELVEKEGVQLIAMPSFTGGAEAILLGSNAREIIRNSKVPVLVKHYQ
ncbi:MAG: universal stress protein, partial [Bdellovibrionales bacterium]|nr:universal stress protein [Bdellovibrionales bacterium]